MAQVFFYLDYIIIDLPNVAWNTQVLRKLTWHELHVFTCICKLNRLHQVYILVRWMSFGCYYIHRFPGVVLLSSLQDVLNNLGSSELDEDDLMLDMDLSDDQRHRHGNFSMLLSMIQCSLIFILKSNIYLFFSWFYLKLHVCWFSSFWVMLLKWVSYCSGISDL